MPIMDKTLLWADDLAYGGTPEVIDLQNAGATPGQPIQYFIQGVGLTGATGYTITDGSTDTAGDAHITHVCSIIGNRVEGYLPSDTARYVTIALTGTVSAGTFTAGIMMPGGQTNI